MHRWQLAGWLTIALGVSACVEPAVQGPTPLMRFEVDDEPYAAPFPSEHLRSADGALDLSALPRGRTRIVEQIHQALVDARGFGTTSAVHLSLEAPLDAASLPSGIVDASDAVVQLIAVEGPDAALRGERAPIRLFFQQDAGPYGGDNVLSALPVQGVPLRSDTLYALVVRRGLRTPEGTLFAAAPQMHTLAGGRVPAGLSESAGIAYRTAYEALDDLGIAPDEVLGMAVFRTADPVAVLRRAAETTDLVLSPSAPFAPAEVFDDYCVFHTTLGVPVYQGGEPPYSTEGGAWRWSSDRRLELDHEEEANLVVTLPRRPMPAEGFPITVLVRTGAGGDRPLVDRGPRAIAGGPAIAPGNGPAQDFARVGWAGISMDGPHGGLRNVSGADEQFLVFNITNPTALRDNLRQSALELVLLARSLDRLRIDATSCPGLETAAVRFDTRHVALMGHSMGASIAPLAAAFEPLYGSLILSGAGASWLENILHKLRPVPTRPLAETLLGYTRLGFTLTEADPVLNLLQWAGEEADAAVYAPLLLRDAAPGQERHVLMFQGIVDTYIPPPVANPLTLALGLDLAGPALDRDTPELASFESVLSVLPLRGRSEIAYPAVGNLDPHGRPVTAVVAQHWGDAVEDGHEAMWQTEPPRAQFRCFLATSVSADAPSVPDPSTPTACP